MEDLIGILFFLIFAGASVIGRLSKNQEEQKPAQTKRTGPVSAPRAPGNPWPQRTGQQPGQDRPASVGPGWPSQPQWDTSPQAAGEGVSLEGRSSMLGGSMEGRSSMVTGTLAEDRARFASETARFRQSRVVSELRNTPAVVERFEQAEDNPAAVALTSREGLAQAILLSEVLGKPRAFRPFGRR